MIIKSRTLPFATDARDLTGIHVVFVVFGRAIAEECDTRESADRVASQWTALGIAATVIHDGKPV